MTQTLSRERLPPALQALITTNVAVFTIRDDLLQLLVQQRTGASPQWQLPGGLLEADEDLDSCAARALSTQTGLTAVYLEQLYTFGHPAEDAHGRVVTVAYYSLAPMDLPPAHANAAGWFPLSDLPELPSQHTRIAELAQQRLRAKLDYSTIAFEFMPEKFTLSELQRVYEIVRGEPLDKRNFRKQILALDLLEDTGEQRRIGSHRPARLYRYRSSGEVQYIK